MVALFGCHAEQPTTPPHIFTPEELAAAKSSRITVSKEAQVGPLHYMVAEAWRSWRPTSLSPIVTVESDRIDGSSAESAGGPARYIVVTLRVTNTGTAPVTIPQPQLALFESTYEQAPEDFLAEDGITGRGRINPGETQFLAASFAVGLARQASDYTLVLGCEGTKSTAVPLAGH